MLQANANESTFELLAVSVDYSSGTPPLALSSEYPKIFGLEDQGTNDSVLISDNLSLVDSIIKSGDFVSVYPTSLDMFRFVAKNPDKNGLPRGTSIKIDSSINDYALYLPTKKY